MSNLVKVEHRIPGADQHVYIGTPAHTIYANFHVSLLRNVLSLVKAGVSVTYAHLSGHPHVDDARNLLVADFLKTGATDFLFWDADVAAEPGAALRLLSYSVDIVGGAYPLKDGSGRFPVKDLKPGTSGGLSEAAVMPTGFLRIKREAFTELARNWYLPTVRLDGTEARLFFQRWQTDDEDVPQRIGGDANFCRMWLRGGGRIHCDPQLMFTHAGVVDFAGRLSDHMSQSEAAQ